MFTTTFWAELSYPAVCSRQTRSGGLLGFCTLRHGLLEDERLKAPYDGNARMF